LRKAASTENGATQKTPSKQRLSGGKMTWLKAEYEFGSLFSYRIPDFSTQYALSSLLPGPSTIRLAIVATAIETTGKVSYGEEIFQAVKNAKIKISLPQKIASSNVLIKRLKKKKDEVVLETTFGIRGYVHYSGPLRIYMEIEGGKENEVGNLMKKIRRFGTSDSLVYCRTVEVREPTANCIGPEEKLDGTAGVNKRFLLIPTRDINPDPEVKFEHVNIYSEEKAGRGISVLVNRFYKIPLINERQGKNYVVYQTSESRQG